MDKIFKNKKIVIMGLGLHGGGASVAEFFYKQGANILITDLKTEKQLEESLKKLKKIKAEYILGEHREEDFKKADLVIKNPDVPNNSPYLTIARKNNIPIETDITLFLNLSKALLIGVTGTKGKSTTATLIYHLLKSKYKRIFLAGNIGVSPLKIISQVRKGDVVVLELSSFGLEDIKKSPHIAVATNIMPDHLNRYKTIEEYTDAKKNIFRFQNNNDFLVLNENDFVVRNFSKEANSKIYFYNGNKIPKNININNFKLFGKHNLSNLAAAIVVAKILKISDTSINKSIKSFKGVASRQQFIKSFKGVKYFNDTTATMPDAVIAAIDSFTNKFEGSELFLICGGQDKGLNFLELIEAIKKNSVNLIFLPGTASELIKNSLKNYNKINSVSSMQEAVLLASKISKKGDIVALSPGAASFNLFKNEFDRGEQFIKAVKNLK